MTGVKGVAFGAAPVFRMTASSSSTASSRGPVFVAGASGRVGQRIVRELANAGVPVRAGCRNEAKV